VPAGRPSIGVHLHDRVERLLQAHPEWGYESTAELVKDLLRRWLSEHEHPPVLPARRLESVTASEK
jgi:Arc/MetJ-type ribon-helix-helix transcriptional regulator